MMVMRVFARCQGSTDVSGADASGTDVRCLRLDNARQVDT